MPPFVVLHLTQFLQEVLCYQYLGNEGKFIFYDCFDHFWDISEYVHILDPLKFLSSDQIGFFFIGRQWKPFTLTYQCPTWLSWRQWILKRSLVKQIKRDASATNPSLLSASEAFPPTWGHRVLPPPPPISEHKQRCTDHYLQLSKHHKKHNYKQTNKCPNISIHRQQKCTLHRH